MKTLLLLALLVSAPAYGHTWYIQWGPKCVDTKNEVKDWVKTYPKIAGPAENPAAAIKYARSSGYKPVVSIVGYGKTLHERVAWMTSPSSWGSDDFFASKAQCTAFITNTNPDLSLTVNGEHVPPPSAPPPPARPSNAGQTEIYAAFQCVHGLRYCTMQESAGYADALGHYHQSPFSSLTECQQYLEIITRTLPDRQGRFVLPGGGIWYECLGKRVNVWH